MTIALNANMWNNLDCMTREYLLSYTYVEFCSEFSQCKCSARARRPGDKICKSVKEWCHRSDNYIDAQNLWWFYYLRKSTISSIADRNYGVQGRDCNSSGAFLVITRDASRFRHRIILAARQREKRRGHPEKSETRCGDRVCIFPPRIFRRCRTCRGIRGDDSTVALVGR